MPPSGRPKETSQAGRESPSKVVEQLAKVTDLLTDAHILAGQHAASCRNLRNPEKPKLDMELLLKKIGDSKELIQSVVKDLDRA